ncbi:MAG: hypothetical protein AAGI51_11945 [Pseudomonadota bacterium]
MITMEDVIGLSGLTEAEIDAIAEHEHIPEIAAAALGAYLLHEEHGPETIVEIIRDDIRHAISQGNQKHAGELLAALRHFLGEHGVGMR